MNTKKIEENLELQLVGTLVFVVATSISAFLIYNEKYHLENNEYIVDKQTAYNILKTNRVIIFILLIVFLYCNIITKEIDLENGNNPNDDKIKADNYGIYAAILSLCAAIIILYVTFVYGKEDVIQSLENPNL
ncbi:MAG: hypothetical protein RSB77_01990 [Bacilli bacterium]